MLESIWFQFGFNLHSSSYSLLLSDKKLFLKDKQSQNLCLNRDFYIFLNSDFFINLLNKFIASEFF